MDGKKRKKRQSSEMGMEIAWYLCMNNLEKLGVCYLLLLHKPGMFKTYQCRCDLNTNLLQFPEKQMKWEGRNKSG